MLQLSNITKKYRTLSGRRVVTAVDNISLKIKKGEIFGLLGPNGAGKTTTVKMICNLIVPTKGKIYINGKNLRKSPRECMKMMSTVLEGSRNIYWRFTPLENCLYFALLRGIKQSIALKRAQKLISSFDLYEKRNTEVRNLSRGMQQKVAICCALVSDPPILILDEPTLGLDVETRSKMRGILLSLTKEDGKTILVTTHDMHLAQAISDRVGILIKGKLTTVASPQELIESFNESQYEILATGKFINQAQKILSSLPALGLVIDNNNNLLIKISLRNSALFYNVVDVLRNNGCNIKRIKEIKTDLEETFLNLTKNTYD